MDYFNPAALTDEAGEVMERYAYSAFGVRTVLNVDFSVRSASECGMEFAFQGQFLDVESGLMNYGYRYYSPRLGRWACKDPIEEAGEINLYRMAGNRVINQVDYLGAITYETDTSKCELNVELVWNVIFHNQIGLPPISGAEKRMWKKNAEQQVENYFNNLAYRCKPATKKCCCCQDGIRVKFDLKYGDTADFTVDVMREVPGGVSWVDRGNRTSSMSMEASLPVHGKAQQTAVHETGHMMGLNHPGSKGAKNEYTKDRESLMGLGMELRLPDFQKVFCDRVKTDKPDCDPWEGE